MKPSVLIPIVFNSFPCILSWSLWSQSFALTILLAQILSRSPISSMFFFFFLSHSVVSNSLWPHGLYSSWNSLGQNTGMGSFSLLQGIFPTQGLNPGFPHCKSLPAKPEGVTTKYICSARILWIHVINYLAYISTQVNNWVPKVLHSSTQNLSW